jgi:lysophospholipase L1-like esterase
VTRKKYKRGYISLIRAILKETQAKKIYIINIADTSEQSKLTYYNYEKNIIDYNATLDDVAKEHQDKVEILNFYEMSKADKNLLLEDGHHISTEAHSLIAELLFNKIKQNEDADF